jgi:hypothetical protein
MDQPVANWSSWGRLELCRWTRRWYWTAILQIASRYPRARSDFGFRLEVDLTSWALAFGVASWVLIAQLGPLVVSLGCQSREVGP